MPIITEEIYVETCKRCLKNWRPRVPNPKQCSNCKSTTWKVERIGGGDQRCRTKYGFEKLEVGQEMRFPFYRLPDGGLDEGANYKRAKALERYMSRKGYTYAWRANIREGLVVYRRS